MVVDKKTQSPICFQVSFVHNRIVVVLCEASDGTVYEEGVGWSFGNPLGCPKCCRFGPMRWMAKTTTFPCLFIKACLLFVLSFSFIV